MQYDLELLEDMITVTLNPKNILLVQPTALEIAEYEQLAQTEKVRIRKRMKSIISKPLKEKYKVKYVHRNQQDIIALKNILLDYLMHIDIKQLEKQACGVLIIQLYKLLFHSLKELLNYIKQYFSSYFNLDEKVPKSYFLRSTYDLQIRGKNIKRELIKRGYDQMVVEVAISPISRLTDSKTPTVTYRQILYIKKLLIALENLKNQSISVSSLPDLLLSMNFNTGNFISYVIADVVDIINALSSQEEKTERLLRWRKEINQVSVKPGVILNPNCVSVKEQLNSWITEEIHYLETKQRLLSVAPVIKDDLLADEEKLHFSVSVNVLSIFVRAAHDSALLLNKRGTLIFKNISKYCRTIQASNLSSESMDKKSHVAERAHKEKAILALQEMIKFVHTY